MTLDRTDPDGAAVHLQLTTGLNDLARKQRVVLTMNESH